METIAAISTPIGSGGISIIRLSGSESKEIAKMLFRPYKTSWEKIEPRKMYLGRVGNQDFGDSCLMVYFKSPYSYTGEDMIELHIHGGVALTYSVLELCYKSGAKPAQAGEYSKRAFLNGKITLSEAEGVIDIINAQCNAEINAAYSLVSGKVSKQAIYIQDELTNLLADIEAALDYPEENLHTAEREYINSKLEPLIDTIKNLYAGADSARYIRDGINIAIAGKPNVGKSSLLNALLEYERAIVTEICGTTRDTISESYIFNNVRFNITDTAGLRDTSDRIEKMGIERSYDSIKSADIVLCVVDNTFSQEDQNIIDNLPIDKTVIVQNKADLEDCDLPIQPAISISAKTGHNIKELKQKMYDMVLGGKALSGGTLIVNARHIDALRRALASLEHAAQANQPDLAAMDIQEAWQHLGEISGTTVGEEIINRIFSRFCLGK